MMTFTEKDTANLVEFLNMVAQRAKFEDLKVKEVIRLYGLLSWAQKDLLNKIESNILEIKEVRQMVKEEEKPATKKASKPKVG
jgi:glutaredoxin-related protein